jgi:hypothetical protein
MRNRLWIPNRTRLEQVPGIILPTRLPLDLPWEPPWWERGQRWWLSPRAAYGFVGESALATGTTTVTPVYASAVAPNLLVATVTAQMTTPGSFTLTGATTGWVQGPNIGATNIQTEIWYKVAVGSDVMPTWNMAAGTEAACTISEYSFAAATSHVLDKSGTATGTTTPVTVTAGGTDTTATDLIVCVRKVRASGAGLNATSTDNVNGAGVGTNINVLNDDGGTSQSSHHHDLYVTAAATGGSADTDVATWTQVTTHAALAIASFKPVFAAAANSNFLAFM